jgi:hypothetical protein
MNSFAFLNQLLDGELMKGKQYKVPAAGAIPDDIKEDAELQEKITFVALDSKTYHVDYLIDKPNDFESVPDKIDDKDEE